MQQTSEAQKQASALKRFVTVLPSEPHAPTFFLSEVDDKTQSLQSHDTENEEKNDNVKGVESHYDSDSAIAEESFKVSLDKIIIHDPGDWPVNLSAKDSDILVQRGPEQISDTDFPVNKDGRRFSVNNYRRRMSNGEEVSHPWLIYSVSKDVIFAFAADCLAQYEHLCLQRLGTPTGSTCLNYY